MHSFKFVVRVIFSQGFRVILKSIEALAAPIFLTTKKPSAKDYTTAINGKYFYSESVFSIGLTFARDPLDRKCFRKVMLGIKPMYF